MPHWRCCYPEEGSGNTPKFLSTHPAPKERINDIEKYLPRVLPLYQQQKR